MARYRNMPTGVGVAWICDLTFPVGPGRANQRDDVQLVQHAINTLMATFELRREDGSLITTYLKRDGLFGPKTKEAILAYQKSRKAAGKYIGTDGLVNPSSATGWTAKGDAQYTIVYLNRDHRDVYGKMMDDKDFPEPLKTSIKTSKLVEG